MKRPKTDKEWALYRCKLSCDIGKRACEGVGIPDGIKPESWTLYQLFAAIEDLALAMQDKNRD